MSNGGPPPSPWLLLWDIDGTLLLRASASHAQAVWDTLSAVHGIEGRTMPAGQRTAGMTDGQICREILTAAGIPEATIDEHAPTVLTRTCEIYAPGDLAAHVNPGIPSLLRELHERDDVVQSLVTGNFESIARRKLAAAGIGDWFAPDLGGGFGSDHEQRERLPAVARARAGAALRPDGSPWPAERTVVIGDTPRDIACARHDGVHAVAVATGPHPVDELAHADAVAADAAELREALLRLISSSPVTATDPISETPS